MPSIRTRTFRNISIIGAAQLSVLVLVLVMMTVLARLLTPEDFGIASLGIVLMALFTTVQDFGITQAVVQRDTRVDESIAVGLFMRWAIAGMLVAFIVVFSGPIADFYANSAVSAVLIVMSINLFVQPIAFPSLVMLTRELQFRCLAIGTLTQYATMSSLSIVLAFSGFSYWSIVYGSLAGTAAYVAVLRYYMRIHVRPAVEMGLAKELFGFGAHLLVAALMAYVAFNVDQLVIGKVFGVAVLGVYFVAVRFGRTFGEQISGTVNKVLFPTMARMKDSLIKLKTGYVESLRMIAVVTIPISLGMAALSPMFVEVVLGNSWTEAIIPLSILSIQGLMNALIPPAASVLMAIGKPKYMSVQSSIQALIMVIAIYPVASNYGINGVCAFTTVISFCVFAYFLIVFGGIFRVKSSELAAPMLPAAVSGVLMFIILAVCVDRLDPSISWLVALSIGGVCIYLACLHIFSRGKDLRDVLSLIKGSMRDNM